MASPGVYVDIDPALRQTRPVSATTRLAVARILLIGVFLLPIGFSSLRGLSHVLTCRERVAAPFQVILLNGEAVVSSAQQIEPGADGGLCGGLTVEVSAAALNDGKVEVVVPISNGTDSDWFGSVELDVAGVRFPVDLGRVNAGETRRQRLELNLPEGTTEFSGVLMIGP